jgi:hypothetical protein
MQFTDHAICERIPTPSLKSLSFPKKRAVAAGDRPSQQPLWGQHTLGLVAICGAIDRLAVEVSSIFHEVAAPAIAIDTTQRAGVEPGWDAPCWRPVCLAARLSVDIVHASGLGDTDMLDFSTPRHYDLSRRLGPVGFRRDAPKPVAPSALGSTLQSGRQTQCRTSSPTRG